MTSRLINGLVLVVLGAILLMNTMGYLPWSVWDASLAYWPILLVGLGLQVAVSRWRFPGLALAVVVIIVLAAMHPYEGPSVLRDWRWLGPGARWYRPENGKKEWSVPLKPTTSRLELILQAPSLDVEARGDPGLNAVQPGLALAAMLYWDREEPKVSVQEIQGGATTRAAVKSVDEGRNPGKQSWELRLNPSLSTSISVAGGVSNIALDTGSAFLQSLDVSSGVTRLDLTLGLSGKETSVHVTGGVASISLNVPETAGIRISLTDTLAISSDFTKQGLVKAGNAWSTPDYASATTKLDVSVTCGTGKVTLVRSAWD